MKTILIYDCRSAYKIVNTAVVGWGRGAVLLCYVMLLAWGVCVWVTGGATVGLEQAGGKPNPRLTQTHNRTSRGTCTPGCSDSGTSAGPCRTRYGYSCSIGPTAVCTTTYGVVRDMRSNISFPEAGFQKRSMALGTRGGDSKQCRDRCEDALPYVCEL